MSGNNAKFFDAIKRGDFEYIKTAVAGQIDCLNIRDWDGATVLHVAGSTNYTILKYFLGLPGIQSILEVKNQDLHTALHKSINSGLGPVVTPANIELLLKAGAQVNCYNGRRNTPLHDLSVWNRQDDIKLLLRYGADVNQVNFEEISPLDRMLRWPNLEPAAKISCAHVLLSAGALITDSSIEEITKLYGPAAPIPFISKLAVFDVIIDELPTIEDKDKLAKVVQDLTYLETATLLGRLNFKYHKIAMGYDTLDAFQSAIKPMDDLMRGIFDHRDMRHIAEDAFEDTHTVSGAAQHHVD